MFRDVGFTNAQLMEVPSGYPPIYGEIPGPEGSPVVMLYGHYDVQPAPPEQGWTTDPWTPTRQADGRIYGRGAADDKGGLAIHLGTMRIFEGKPPCTIRLIVEGMEETESNLEPFVDAHPELFDCDLFIVCDMGNLRVGEPVLTTALRGDVACIVTVRTLQHPLHSGLFGGAAPDAMMALARLLATLVDDEGTVAVPGVTSGEWDGAEFSPEDLRSSADLLEGATSWAPGPVASRLWAKPSINAIGVDMTSIAGSSNVLVPEARAKISMRIVPGSEPENGAGRPRQPPRGARAVGRGDRGATHQGGPRVQVQDRRTRLRRRRQALEEAYGKPVGDAGSGGSIPLLRKLQDGCAAGRVHPVGS